MVRLKLSKGAVFSLRETLEAFLGDNMPMDYVNLIEQHIIGRLLKRKMTMFHYPKPVNTLTLDDAEAAIIYRLMQINSMFVDVGLSRRLIDFIGRALPEKLIEKK